MTFQEWSEDPDEQLQAWHEAQGATPQHDSGHRCPSNVPPCPICQEKDDAEDPQV